MFITHGIPGALGNFDSVQSLEEDFNLGNGCRKLSRQSNMDEDYDEENVGYDDRQSISFEEDEWSDEPSELESISDEERGGDFS
jgi:hypothetical protein